MTSPLALADSHTLGTDNNSVTFSDLSLVDGSPDDGTCAQRYGSGYTTTDKEGAEDDNKQKSTEQGHDILISSTGGSIGDGILSIENEYAIIFPEDEKKEPVDVKMFATGLIGSGEASGVFSDGTCRGSVTIKAATN